MDLSLVIPVYNRPDEVEELLRSLFEQSDMDFEIVIVEDGSTLPCKDRVEQFQFPRIQYLYKENSGPGPSRNYGMERANGDFFVILDSDCVLPPDYISAVKRGVAQTGCDAFGGPDRASEDFDDMQKAVSYSMTSFFTTGGIRGGGEKMDKFHPRSFNMGISRAVFEKTGGFSQMRYGEDIDFSIRIMKAGFKTVLLKEAWVYHKRRTDMRAFFRQVNHSGAARVELTRRHPGTLKFVHLLPSLFTLGCALLLLGFFASALFAVAFFLFPRPELGSAAGATLAALLFLAPLCLYALLIFGDACARNGVKVARLSVRTSFVQLWGYGSGFIRALFS
jgi:GT2 family glycosyltransferase